MAIPSNITEGHVDMARKEIDINGVPKMREAWGHYVEIDDERYPPKYLLGLANKFANGEELNANAFVTNDAVAYLKKLGLELGEHIDDPFNNVLIYEVKRSSVSNASKLFSKSEEYFYWNQSKFNNIDKGDPVIVVNKNEGYVLVARLEETGIPSVYDQASDTTSFTHFGTEYNVDGKFGDFVMLNIRARVDSPSFEWKSLGSSEITYIYGLNTSTENIDNNRVRLSQLEDVFKDNELASSVLLQCRLFLDGDSIVDLIEEFVEQANTDDLTFKKYKQDFQGLNIKASFGQGTKSSIPWMSFMFPGQTTSNGIYPVLLYFLEHSCLVLSYGISETNDPDGNWNLVNPVSVSDFMVEQFEVEPDRYGSSYYYSHYDLSKANFVDHKMELRRDLATIIREYKKLFMGEKPSVMSNSLFATRNIILYGPPGTGKTFATVEHALSRIENIAVEEVRKRKREENRKRYEKLLNSQVFFTTFHQSYAYEEFIEGIRPTVKDGFVSYDVLPGVFKRLVAIAKEKDNRDNQYVLIIDEINRGNVSDIFGELITLLEDSKRLGQAESTEVVLPYSNHTFGIPSNIHVIGTMNTADKSISLIDTALRRRFHFIETPPDYDVIQKRVGKRGVVDGVDVVKLLQTLNSRVTFLLDDDHAIGHAEFLEAESFSDVCKVLRNKIIPLLQEYFHGEFESIRNVLGDGETWRKPVEYQIFRTNESALQEKLFGAEIDGYEGSKAYVLNDDLAQGHYDKLPLEVITMIYTKPY